MSFVIICMCELQTIYICEYFKFAYVKYFLYLCSEI
jgi:hypothetical protein